MTDCIFCKIVAGEIPCYKVYEDDEFIAFLDISQFVEGHTLLIPKKHYQFIWDVDNIAGMSEVAKEISNHYKSLGYEFVDSAIFGRDVPHAHWHLIPHNDDNNDWKKALSEIGAMQKDSSRRISKDDGLATVKKFSL